MDADRLQRVLGRLDDLNRADPTKDMIEGTAQPRELVYAERLTRWVLQLDAKASEALRIAARGQHVQRWTIPRENYPRTRKGYLRWRETLKAFHAKTVTAIMREEGYATKDIDHVRAIIVKKHLSDHDTQTIEDALCLVFLETQFGELRRKTPEETMRTVVKKTWRKMSAKAREEVARITFAPDDYAWLKRVLEETG